LKQLGLVLALFAGTTLHAQSSGRSSIWPHYQRSVDPFPVANDSGRAYTFPFLGGFDHPRPQLVDIDGDGDLDLFIQEYPGRMTFFERSGARGDQAAAYTWRTDQWLGLDIGEWSRFVDVDGDGDLDLLAESRYSFIRYWRNDGGRRTPAFSVGADTVKDVSGTPIFADRQNIPQLADLDCNGKLDLMLGRVDGTVTRYELQSMDSAGAPRFRPVIERFEDIQIIGGDANQKGPPGPTLHGANTMALTDVDGDGDLDILWGDFFEPGLLWIRNNGTCSAPAMRDTPLKFPVNDPLRTSGYNAPAVADLDGDGDRDLLVGVIGGAYDPTLTAGENLYYLEQTTPGDYAVRTRAFIDQLDVGSESSPALADLDGDGDLDLIIGNKIEPGNSGGGALFFFRNVGSARAPSFRAGGRIVVPAAYHYAPALADLDGDGKPDLILGTWQNAVQFYRGDGTAGQPHFTLVDSALVTLTRGSHATPFLADLDGDGDLDMVVGEGSGSINYYRNDGTRSAPRFTLVSDEWLGLRPGRRSVPRLVDLDGDGKLDLVVGTENGRPMILRNTGTRTEPAFAADPVELDWPPLTAPAFADLDGDGRLDLLLGNAGGGLLYYHRLP
jgi:uncharacterized protein (DUF2141 family)